MPGSSEVCTGIRMRKHRVRIGIFCTEGSILALAFGFKLTYLWVELLNLKVRTCWKGERGYNLRTMHWLHTQPTPLTHTQKPGGYGSVHSLTGLYAGGCGWEGCSPVRDTTVFKPLSCSLSLSNRCRITQQKQLQLQRWKAELSHRLLPLT